MHKESHLCPVSRTQGVKFLSRRAICSADAPPSEKLAASIAVGLVNRKFGNATAVTLNSPNDWKWVNNIRNGAELRERRWVKASVPDFIAFAVSVGRALTGLEFH